MIKAPNFCKNAVPSLQGWRHPRTGELLKSQRISQAQIDEWHGITIEDKVEPVQDETPANEEIDVDLQSMTKLELEEFARDHGVELDRRFSKAKLLDQVTSLFKS